MTTPNNFRKLPAIQTPDVSKLPENIRKALNIPIPMRDRELFAALYTYRRTSCVHPHTRLHVGWNMDLDVERNTIGIIALKSFKGDEDYAQIHMPVADLRILLGHLQSLLDEADGVTPAAPVPSPVEEEDGEEG